MTEQRVDVVEPTPRVCRYCRKPYLAPLGSRPHACRDCAPTIEMAIEDAIPATPATGGTPTPSSAALDGVASSLAERAASLPAPPDRFQGECERKMCSNDAAVLIDGSYLCVDCADDLLDRAEAAAIYPGIGNVLPAFWEA